MGIALTLKQYLDEQHVPYVLESHKPTKTSLATAHASAVESQDVAKGVLTRCRDGYILAVVPASHRLDLDRLGGWLGQPVSLACEDDLAAVFEDCASGCAPALAAAYGLNAIVDTHFNGRGDVYFEAGDHRTLVHMGGRDFDRLYRDTPRVHISAR